MAENFLPLPFAQDALEPYISSQTLAFHHGGHYRAYVENYNRAIEGTPYETQPIETVIQAVVNDRSQFRLFVNAAQAWNHHFYWQCLKPKGGGAPTGPVAAQIKGDFGSFEQFLQVFQQSGQALFGSGWTWLVWDRDRIKVTNTANADTPLTQGQIPLLVIDLWEHAYYTDYPNQRARYINTFLQQLVNWDFVSSNFEQILRT